MVSMMKHSWWSKLNMSDAILENLAAVFVGRISKDFYLQLWSLQNVKKVYIRKRASTVFKRFSHYVKKDILRSKAWSDCRLWCAVERYRGNVCTVCPSQLLSSDDSRLVCDLWQELSALQEQIVDIGSSFLPQLKIKYLESNDNHLQLQSTLPNF